MPTLLLTDIVVRNAKPVPGKQVSIWDATTRNFGMRINPKGTKTWQVMLGGKRRRVTLGHYPDMTLKEARKLALKALGDAESSPERSTERTPYAVSAAVAKYIKVRHAHSRPRHAKGEEWLLSRHLIAKHPNFPIDKFTATHIVGITDTLSDHPALQFHVHRSIASFFKWAVHRQLIPSSPAASLPKPGRVSQRDRLLSNDEVKRIYKAANDIGYPYGSMCRIALHTGMRRGEVGSLKWSYITNDAITLPAAATKNKREHVLPNLIADELAAIPRKKLPDGTDCDYIFPSSVFTPYSTWSDGKAELDKRCKIENFVFHDFRRYLSSAMAKLGVRIDVTEAILNHVSGSRSPIQRVYDRHDRLPEMRAALTLYERHLSAIVSS